MFLAAVLYGFYLGFSEGIVNTIFRVLSIFLAFMMAFKFSPYMTQALEKAFNFDSPLTFIAGFVVTFFLTMWTIRWVAEMMTTIMEVSHVNLPNQIIGGGVLGLLFAFLFSVIVWFGNSAGMVSSETKNQSIFYVYSESLRENTFVFFQKVRPVLGDFFKETGKMMDRLEENHRKNSDRSEQKTDIYDLEEEKPAAKPEVKPTETVQPRQSSPAPSTERYRR